MQIIYIHIYRGGDVAQAVEHSAVKVWILMHGRSIMYDKAFAV